VPVAAPAAAPKLTYRTLGKTGLRVTSLSFGCMTTSDPSVIERAADIGIIHFDTARGYQAATAGEAEMQLDMLASKWDASYPSVSQIWRRNWDHITPLFNYPAEIRRAIYTTNAVEALNRSLRKVIKTRGAFPTEDAALKLLFLALRAAEKKWTMPIHDWPAALNYFTVLWPEWMPALERR